MNKGEMNENIHFLRNVGMRIFVMLHFEILWLHEF